MQPKGVQNSQKQIPTTRYSRQLGDNAEAVMLAVFNATLGPDTSRRLSANEHSFEWIFSAERAGMIQALEVKSLVRFDDPMRAVSAKCESRKIGLHGGESDGYDSTCNICCRAVGSISN